MFSLWSSLLPHLFEGNIYFNKTQQWWTSFVWKWSFVWKLRFLWKWGFVWNNMLFENQVSYKKTKTFRTPERPTSLFKLRLEAYIPRSVCPSVCLYVCLSVCPTQKLEKNKFCEYRWKAEGRRLKLKAEDWQLKAEDWKKHFKLKAER